MSLLAELNRVLGVRSYKYVAPTELVIRSAESEGRAHLSFVICHSLGKLSPRWSI